MRRLAAIVVASLATGAHGQGIKIPDFREPPRATLKPGEPCERCGTILSIREVQLRRPVNVPKAFQNEPLDRGPSAPVLVGAVVALPLGAGTEKPFVGGVGTPEMRDRFTETAYEIAIRLDNGSDAFVQRADGASFRIGDRVRVMSTQLELLAP
jgi:outer membrane lipoprotein SlyB